MNTPLDDEWKQAGRSATGWQKIVGGRPDEEFLDCVALGKAHEDDWCCAGVLIAPNVVVTAAHCFGGCAFRVRIPSTTAAGEPRIIEVDRDKSRELREHDLAVLILKEHVDAAIRPRAIASSAAIDAATSVRAVGYGRTTADGLRPPGHPAGEPLYGEVRRFVDITIVSASCDAQAAADYNCREGWELVAAAPGRPANAATGDPGVEPRDTCPNDSGGPIYIQEDGEWRLAGITSRSVHPAARLCGDGGIYVRIDKHRQWIEDVQEGRVPAH